MAVHFRRVRSRGGERQLGWHRAKKEHACEQPDATKGVNSKGEDGRVAEEEVANDAVYSGPDVRIMFITVA